jgi:hypothetical protein
MRAIVRTALSAACLALCAPAALAHHPGIGGGGEEAGPIGTISAATLEQGHASVSLIYEFIKIRSLSDAAMAAAVTPDTHIHTLRSIASLAASFAYGVTDDLTISLRVPWVRRSGIREAHQHDPLDPVEFHSLGNASGIGDVTAIAQFRLLNDRVSGTEAALLLGLKAPTGRTNALTSGGELFDAEFQPGSGSWDGIFGAAFSQRLGEGLALHANVLYVLVGTGTQSTNLGDRFLYNAALVYRLFGPPSPLAAMAHADHRHGPNAPPHTHEAPPPGPALDVMLELNGEWHRHATAAGVLDPNSGGNVIYLSPGARLTVDRWSAFLSVGFPIVTDLNGVQARPGWRVLTGASVGF